MLILKSAIDKYLHEFWYAWPQTTNYALCRFHHFVHVKAEKRQACRLLPLTALVISFCQGFKKKTCKQWRNPVLNWSCVYFFLAQIFAAFLAVTFFQSQTKFVRSLRIVLPRSCLNYCGFAHTKSQNMCARFTICFQLRAWVRFGLATPSCLLRMSLVERYHAQHMLASSRLRCTKLSTTRLWGCSILFSLSL